MTETNDRLTAGEAAIARVEQGGGNPTAEQDRAAVGATVSAMAKPKKPYRNRRKMSVPGRDAAQAPALYLSAGDDDDQASEDVAKPRTEAELWRANLAVLRAAVADRKPGMLKRLGREIERMTAERKQVEAQQGLVPATEEQEQERREADLAKRRNAAEEALRRLDEERVHLTARRARLVERVQQRTASLASVHRRLSQRLKQLGSLEDQAKRKPEKKHDEGRAPDRIDKPAVRNTIELLEERHKITAEQAKAAQTIQAINEAISSAGRPRVVQLGGTSGGGGFSDLVISPALDALRSRKYLPWIRALTESTPVAVKIVLAIAVEGKSLDAVAREHRMRRHKALGLLKFALDAYRRQRPISHRA